MKLKILVLLWLLSVVFMFGACDENTSYLDELTTNQLIEYAKEEHFVYSVAMPNHWANLEETWRQFENSYVISHHDLDMSSAEVLELFRVQKENTIRDIGEVDFSYAAKAEKDGLTLKYKTSYWEEIPNWAKDTDGDWIVGYTGSIAFLINNHRVNPLPSSWNDVLNGDYMVTIGDVVSATQSQCAVLAANFAMGGSLDNLNPGFDYFKKLAKQGRLDKQYSSRERIISGESDLVILWDFNALGYSYKAKATDKTLSFTTLIPTDGSVQSGYSTIINKYATNPHAAALVREFILSDQGQLNLAKGFAKPIRNIELPEEVNSLLIPEDQYENVIIMKDSTSLYNACQKVAKTWVEEVVPIIE